MLQQHLSAAIALSPWPCGAETSHSYLFLDADGTKGSSEAAEVEIQQQLLRQAR